MYFNHIHSSCIWFFYYISIGYIYGLNVDITYYLNVKFRMNTMTNNIKKSVFMMALCSLAIVELGLVYVATLLG